jgi:hypothetical protein
MLIPLKFTPFLAIEFISLRTKILSDLNSPLQQIVRDIVPGQKVDFVNYRTTLVRILQDLKVELDRMPNIQKTSVPPQKKRTFKTRWRRFLEK